MNLGIQNLTKMAVAAVIDTGKAELDLITSNWSNIVGEVLKHGNKGPGEKGKPLNISMNMWTNNWRIGTTCFRASKR